MNTSDVIIIGGGAAGLMCALESGKRGRKVTVLEHGERLGKKILISGGGRCNFTNVNASAENYLSQNPPYCKSALARYQPADFIALVERHGINYHEKKLGQLFCDVSSKQIVEMLETECRDAGVQVCLNTRVQTLRKPLNFEVQTESGTWTSQSVVVACGGLSFPKMGATSLGYEIAKSFGIGLVPCQPGLVPLVLEPSLLSAFSDLSGISLDVETKSAGATFRENILFTHRGLSGPAILQISSYLAPKERFKIDLLPGKNSRDYLDSARTGNKELKTVLNQFFPMRFAQKWCDHLGSSLPLHQYSHTALDKIADGLHNWELIPPDTEGYAKAEVTVGGVDTRELSSKTMESRKVSGLYFIGEVVDVTGWLGGYNFQWAWASGHAAGQFA